MNKTLTMMIYSFALAIASPVVIADNRLQQESVVVNAQLELEAAIQQAAGVMFEQIRQETEKDLKNNIRHQLQK